MKLKKLMAAALCILMLAGLAACSGDNTPTVDKIKKNGELVMLTNATFPPYEYVEGNEVVGVDVDIAQQIADELGVKLKVVNMDFDPIIDFIKAGKGDIGAAGLTVNEERLKEVDFSVEYTTSKQFIIVKADTDIETFTPDGKVIGVQQGTTGDIYIASDKEVVDTAEENIKRYKSSIDAAEALKLGKIDCVIIDELPAKKIVENNPELTCFDNGYEEESYAIAIQKGNSTLVEVVNKVLERLISEGKIAEYTIKHS